MPLPPDPPLETIPNPHPERSYDIAIECPEFTCLCPRTGQPDFAILRIAYVPAARLVELKSLKLYLGRYRAQGLFHEAATNRILDDLVAALAPRRLEVVADFNVRGGLHTVVTVRYRDPAVEAGGPAAEAPSRQNV